MPIVDWRTPKERLAICNRVLKHWHYNLHRAYAGVLIEDHIDADKCAFCQEFASDACKMCPIRRVTRKRACHGVDYYRVNYSIGWREEDMQADTPEKVESLVRQLEEICEWYCNKAK